MRSRGAARHQGRRRDPEENLPIAAVTAFRIAATVLLLALAAGCSRGPRREFLSPYPAGAAVAVSRAEDVAPRLAETASAHPLLWARADLVISIEGRKGRDLVTATLLRREPGDLRLRGSRAPIGTVFEVLLDAEGRAWLYANREDRLFEGTRQQLREKLGAVGGVEPEDLVHAILVQQRLREFLADPAGWGIEDKGDAFLFARRDPAGRQLFWRLRKADGLVEEYLVRSRSGIPLLSVRYTEYRLVDVRGRMEPLPWRFQVRVPASRATIDAKLDGYKIDPPLRDKAFAVPEASERYPMTALEFAEE